MFTLHMANAAVLLAKTQEPAEDVTPVVLPDPAPTVPAPEAKVTFTVTARSVGAALFRNTESTVTPVLAAMGAMGTDAFTV
jgi:hypothetical protein